MRARFDDARGRTGFELTEPVDEVVAHRIDEVVPALRSVEELAARGLWAAGVVSYEAGPAFDPALRTRPGAAPLLHFGLFRSRRPIEELSRGPYRVGPWEPSVDERTFGRAVDRIRRLIEDGDTYQVNFTFRLDAGFEGDAEAFYEDLGVAQAGAFSAYLDLGDRKILSASPELFFELVGTRLVTRPMKGTRPRGRWTSEDLALAEELSGSSKERAENVMIVDLMRNDLGRISEFGSVVADRVFEAERYPTVWQLTSTVTSTVRPEVGVTGIFRALFPSGSVTGAPKPRTTEIIAELEDRPRGPYCGAIGFIAPPAEDILARFAVGIRTVLVTGRHAEFGVGAGITHPSSGDAEYRECLTKAAMLGVRRPAVGLVEALRWEGGFLWEERHLDRLEGSAAYFGLPFNRPQAKAALRRAVRGRPAGPHKVRLVLDESGEMSVTCEPLLDPVGEELLVAVDSEPVDSGDPLLFHKTTHREPFQRRLGRHAEADDVLLVNERGELTESTVANLVVRLDGRWWTPPLESGCLPGVHRAVLVEEGIVSERVVRPEDLERADGIGLVNSVRLWRSARLSGPPSGRGPGESLSVSSRGMLQILTPEGQLVDDPPLDLDGIRELYGRLVGARLFDRKGVALQRQGRLATYSPYEGQEAAQVGSAATLAPDDWMVPSYRDMAAMWVHGYPWELILLWRAGDERGNSPPQEVRCLPPSITVGAHMIHAVGLAWGERLQGRDRIALSYFGDGATSEGDFHEAMNFAGVYRTATVFVCQNNQYAISLGRGRQTASETIAQKAEAYGFPGVLVDGNDLLAVHQASAEAVRRARAGEGPTLIEALTYRLGPHTTSDDPKRYRDSVEEEHWRARDPLERVRLHLAGAGAWDEAWQQELEKAWGEELDEAVERMEDLPPLEPSDFLGEER